MRQGALKNYSGALQHIDAAIDNNASLLALRRRRDCLDALARNYEAREAAARVVSLAPRNTADILHLAHLNMRVRDLPAAISTLDNGISSLPNSVELYRRKRDYLVHADRLKDAVKAAASVVKIASSDSSDVASLRLLRIRQLQRQATMASRSSLQRLQDYAFRIPRFFMSAEPIAILDTLVSTI